MSYGPARYARPAVIGTAWLALAAPEAAAQRAVAPAPGDQVRLDAPAAAGARPVQGSFVALGGDTVILRAAGADPAAAALRVPLADVRTLRLRARRTRGEGARVGALAGVAAGAAVGAVWIASAVAYDRRHRCESFIVPCERAFYAVPGSVLLATATSGVGAVVGALRPGHAWRRTPAGWLRAATPPAAQPSGGRD
jgi:hypothetical protein